MKPPDRCDLSKLRPYGLLFFGLVFCVLLLLAGRVGDAPAVSAEAEELVAALIQNALGPYHDEATNRATRTSVTYTNIEASFREASRLMPKRLDLRFGVASALTGQALQTNIDFAVAMNQALKVYQEIHSMDKSGFHAPILYAAYARALGDTNASDSTLAQILAVHPDRTRAYREKFRRLEEILKIVPNEIPLISTNLDHAIVILGAGLETNGTPKAKLVDRLQQGLLVANLNPASPIIVTGGNPRSGITEAYAMARWLLNNGVATNRLYLEDQARDTVGNAVRCAAILQNLAVTHVTLVTSASHLRRALADFEEAALRRALRINFSHLVAKDEPPFDPGRERVAVYRDLMRTSGIWAFPGVQR